MTPSATVVVNTFNRSGCLDLIVKGFARQTLRCHL
jgi:hypothetical protein